MSLEPLAASSGAIDSSIGSLKAVYAVLLTLSLGEAFGELVQPPDGGHGGGKEIRRDRILNLFPFLLLLVPFIQGMDRYFYETYNTGARPAAYGGHLLLDCVVFTLEGALFFVLARSLSIHRWRRFYRTVVALLGLDTAWGLIVWIARRPATIQWWLGLDAITIILISLTFAGARNDERVAAEWRRREEKLGRRRVIACLVIILLRTIADYYLSWHYYFPS